MDFRLKLRKLVFIAKKQTNRIRDKCTENIIDRKIAFLQLNLVRKKAIQISSVNIHGCKNANFAYELSSSLCWFKIAIKWIYRTVIWTHFLVISHNFCVFIWSIFRRNRATKCKYVSGKVNGYGKVIWSSICIHFAWVSYFDEPKKRKQREWNRNEQSIRQNVWINARFSCERLHFLHNMHIT